MHLSLEPGLAHQLAHLVGGPREIERPLEQRAKCALPACQSQETWPMEASSSSTRSHNDERRVNINEQSLVVVVLALCRRRRRRHLELEAGRVAWGN